MGQVETRTNWNDLIQRVNSLIASNSLSAAPLSEVAPSHIWRPSDVEAVRTKLQEICTNAPTFSASLVKWTQAIIDELNAAINGCVTLAPMPTTALRSGQYRSLTILTEPTGGIFTILILRSIK